MYKLYWARNTGAFAPQAMLEEIGLPYEKVVIELRKGGHQRADYLAVNPYGRVPAMELPDGTVMTESAAMTLYLADLHPEAGLAPAPGAPERAGFLRWLFFLAAELYTADLLHYHPDHFSTDPGGYDSVKAAGLKAMDAQWELVEAALDPGPYLLGERYSALDPYALMLASWHPDMTGLLARLPRLARLCELVRARPAIARIWGEHAAAA